MLCLLAFLSFGDGFEAVFGWFSLSKMLIPGDQISSRGWRPSGLRGPLERQKHDTEDARLQTKKQK